MILFIICSLLVVPHSHENVIFSCQISLNFHNISLDQRVETTKRDRKLHKVFVTAHVVLCMAAMFLASAPYRDSHAPEILQWLVIPGGNASV